MIERKTKAHIVRGKVQGKRRIPCFINGVTPRPKGVTKLLVYYFDGGGNLIVTMIPARFVEMVEFRLT